MKKKKLVKKIRKQLAFATDQYNYALKTKLTTGESLIKFWDGYIGAVKDILRILE